MKELTKENL